MQVPKDGSELSGPIIRRCDDDGVVLIVRDLYVVYRLLRILRKQNQEFNIRQALIIMFPFERSIPGDYKRNSEGYIQLFRKISPTQ